MNNKGDMVLRNVVFIIIIFSGIMALSSIFVQQIGDTYNNANMISSYNQDTIGSLQLKTTATKWEEIGENLQGNLFEMLKGTLKAGGQILRETLLAPVTFGSMLTSILKDFGVDDSLNIIIGRFIIGILYVLIIFVIISAFLKGGKM